MHSHFSEKPAIETAESKNPGVNVGHTAPLSPEAALEAVLSACDAAVAYDLFYRRKADSADSKIRYKILNVMACIEGSGVHPRFAVDAGEPTDILDPETQKYTTIMKRTISKNDAGEVVFPGFHLDAHKFFEDYEPDFEGCRITRSEWASILQEMEPVLSRGRKLAAQGEKQRAEDNEKIRQAMAAKMNPTQSMADAIGLGVARALAALGVEPKKGKAV